MSAHARGRQRSSPRTNWRADWRKAIKRWYCCVDVWPMMAHRLRSTLPPCATSTEVRHEAGMGTTLGDCGQGSAPGTAHAPGVDVYGCLCPVGAADLQLRV